jgi:biopolymer transport protein ExbD
MAKRKKKEDPFPYEDIEFQIAPMIDVLLVILVFFMSITSVEVMRTNKDVLLAIAQHGQPKENNKDQSVINIVWRGESAPPDIDIDGAPMRGDDLGEIERRLAASVAITPMHRAVIRADRDTQYQFIQQVMNACAAGGCPNIEFAVVDKDTPGAVRR